MQHQEHFGRKFYIDKKTGYWISTDYPRTRAHVWVWVNERGEISKGLHVHHIDGDKSNNDISNLSLINASDHARLHMTDERRSWASKWMEVIRPLTKAWHSSLEGRSWHVKHGIEGWKNKKSITIKCLMCSKEVQTKVYHQKFCHPNCKAKYGRRVLKSKECEEAG